MIYGLWQSAAGVQTNSYRMDVAANNLANVETAAFKQDLALIHERDIERIARPGGGEFRHDVLDDMTGGPWVKPTYLTFEQGAVESTGRPLDVALNGAGFFEVDDGGETRYTRDGRFMRNGEGDLVMVTGGGRVRVLNEGGGPIKLASSGTVSISDDGMVRQNGQVLGRLRVVNFADPQQLRKMGSSLYMAGDDAEEIPSDARVQSGHIERSTVSPVDGLASMIKISRAYQMNANMIQLQDQTLNAAVNRVGRIG